MDKPEPLQFLTQGPVAWTLAAFWGAIWGSFYNVLIVRLPAGESISRPASHCRACGVPLRWYDNIPIVSFVVLRGRCRRCGARFAARYLLVEILACALALAAFRIEVVDGTAPLGLRLARFVIASLFCGLLVAIALIDIDTMKIPNVITYPGIPVCTALSLFWELPWWWEGAAGAAAGYLVLRAFADGYRLLTGREGMGYGDAKLLAMIGGLLGWRALLPVLFGASLQGSLIGIAAVAVARRRGRGEARAPLRHARVPFGPFLSLAAIETLLLRERVLELFPFLLAG